MPSEEWSGSKGINREEGEGFPQGVMRAELRRARRSFLGGDREESLFGEGEYSVAKF